MKAAGEPSAVDTLALLLDRAREEAAKKEWESALSIYDRLIAQQPANISLLVERARVLGWSGDYDGAAAALAVVNARGGPDPDLLLERARYLWWAGNYEEAAIAASAVLRLRPGDQEARTLQADARAAQLPSAEVARRWLIEQETPLTHLWLARALAREGNVAEALDHYRTAAGSGLFGDSIFLEYASMALTADSPRVAATALEQYLYLYQPQDRQARIQLARAYAWAELTDKALATYADLLAVEDDPTLRFERAQLLAWNGRERDAERELLLVLETELDHAGALRLLGDLAFWRGDTSLALSRYRRAHALAPQLEGLTVALATAEARELEEQEAELHEAGAVRWLTEPWRITAEAFGDSEDFFWFGSPARKDWGDAGRSLGFVVRQGYSDGPRLVGGGFRSTGFGAQIEGRARLGARLIGRAGLGILDYSDVGSFATWALGLELRDGHGGMTALGYERQPAVRAALTAASLGAETIADQLKLTHARPLGAGSFGGEALVERFDSGLGTTTRYAGSLVVTHPLAAGLTAGALVRALSASDASPVLTDWGTLYWAPRYFIMPGVQLGYGTEFGEGWTLGLRVTPGVAFIDERHGGIQRFGTDRTTLLETGLDLGYQAGSWHFLVGGDWGGALSSGYRAAALRIQITPVMGGKR
jgi:Flp pilus assembly protein TadD